MVQSMIELVRAKAATLGVVVHSKRCLSHDTKLTFICPKCNQLFLTNWRTFKRSVNGCCQSCNRLRGSDNPASKKLSDAERAARNPNVRLAEHRRFERVIFERDGYRCVITGYRLGKNQPLTAHHLNNWAEFPALRVEVGNGVTILKKLHDRFHSEYGHRCTREQFIEFADKIRHEMALV